MTNYVLNEEKMFADITDGIAIIINSETGIYYGMNPLGTCIYENIINGVDTDEILSVLKSMPEIPKDLEDNFNLFISAMLEKDILIESERRQTKPEISENLAKQCDYIIDIREYNDAQELLLADPIHEVKEDTGWTPEKSSIIEDKEEVARKEARMEV